MVNSLTKAPAFEQEAQHTDFLVVISAETISGAVTAKVSNIGTRVSPGPGSEPGVRISLILKDMGKALSQ